MTLHEAQATLIDSQTVQVDLIWSADTPLPPSLTVFVHIAGTTGNIAQDDAPPGNGRWPTDWWRPGLYLHDRHTITLPESYDPAQHKIYVGLYDAQTGERLPVVTASGKPIGDSFKLLIDD
jgi:hypothetical protein